MTIIFALESLMKVLTYGFLFNGEKSYLRNGWNIMDYLIVCFSVSSFPLIAIDCECFLWRPSESKLYKSVQNAENLETTENDHSKQRTQGCCNGHHECYPWHFQRADHRSFLLPPFRHPWNQFVQREVVLLRNGRNQLSRWNCGRYQMGLS